MNFLSRNLDFKKEFNLKLPIIILASLTNCVAGKLFLSGKREGCVNLVFLRPKFLLLAFWGDLKDLNMSCEKRP